MSSFNICSQCLRALRQTVRAEARVNLQLQASRAQNQALSNRRYLSTPSSRWQQETARRVNEEPLEQPAAVPFTTVSTGTSNITATAPPEHTETQIPKEHKSSAQPTPDVSTSKMQREIRSSLSKPSLPARLAETLKRNVPAATKSYTIYGQTEALFKSCAAQADYTIPQDQRMNIITGKGPVKETSQGGAELGQPLPENADAWWFTSIDLPPTFSTWSQVTFLHMYILVAQLRGVAESDADFQNYHRYLIEHFSRAAEDKMILLHNMNAQGIRSRYLKDLFLQWRGILASYDEGLVKGDAVLASALWRNLFRADENADWGKVALVVAFVRRTVSVVGSKSMDQMIESMSTQTSLWALGKAPRTSVQQLVDKPSSRLNEPITE